MIPVKPDARRIILLEATIVTYLLILQDQRVEWEQQQKGRPTSTWCVPMCAAWVEISSSEGENGAAGLPLPGDGSHAERLCDVNSLDDGLVGRLLFSCWQYL